MTKELSSDHSLDAWFDRLGQVLPKAAKRCDVATIRTTQQLLNYLILVWEMHDAFHRAPRRNVDGKGGVTRQLGYASRKSLYDMFRQLCLPVGDFRNTELCTADIVLRSPTIRPVLQEVLAYADTSEPPPAAPAPPPAP